MVGHKEGYNMTIESIYSKESCTCTPADIADMRNQLQRGFTIIFCNSEVLPLLFSVDNAVMEQIIIL